eukprot:UN08700
MPNLSITEQLKQRNLRLQTNNDDQKEQQFAAETQSKSSQIELLKKEITEKETAMQIIRSELTELNKQLSKLTSNAISFQPQNSNQQNVNINQQAMDHEIALQMQRNFDNEENKMQEREEIPQNSHRFEFETQRTFGPSLDVFNEMNSLLNGPMFHAISSFSNNNINRNSLSHSLFSFHGNPVNMDSMSFEQLSNMFPPIPRS